jgi:hypothetical protein
MRCALAPSGKSQPWPTGPLSKTVFSKADFALLEPHPEPAALPMRKVLEKRGRPIKAIYFPDSGFASVVADAGKPIEVGLIGARV